MSLSVDILKALLEQGTNFAALGIGAYILWKRYDKFVQRIQVKLDETEKRMQDYMVSDRQKLLMLAEAQQRVINDNTDAMRSIQRSMDRHTKIMECVMTEIKETRAERRRNDS